METNLETDQQTIVKVFLRPLTREGQVLTRQPDLLWQQFYNRLQWEGDYPIEGWVEEIITLP